MINHISHIRYSRNFADHSTTTHIVNNTPGTRRTTNKHQITSHLTFRRDIQLHQHRTPFGGLIQTRQPEPKRGFEH